MEKFGYAVLERALAKVFKLSPDAQAGVLRGRIIHLRRGGFGPQEAGRGNRIKYDHETAVKWLLALLLADAGVSPRTIQSLLRKTGSNTPARLSPAPADQRPICTLQSTIRRCAPPPAARIL